MKLVTYDEFVPGLLQDGWVYDLTGVTNGLGVLGWDEVMPAIIANFDRLSDQIRALAQSGEGRPVEQVRLRAPIPRPAKIACSVMNSPESRDQETTAMDFYFKSPEAVIGMGDTVVLPKLTASQFPHEAELAVIIAKEGTNVPANEAMSHVFGYTAFIDVSARDVGRPRVGTFFGYSFDTFAPMGPWLVTADEIPDPHNLQVTLSVNGKLRQDYNTGEMAHRIPALIEYASSIFTLYPGEVITCGTNPKGVGPLQDGDQVVMVVQKIGSFTTAVRDPLKREWPSE